MGRQVCEIKIIEQCKQGNMVARGQLFDVYKDQVYRTAYLITKSESLADDVTQETFIRVFAKIDSYDGSKAFEPWLYRVSINVAKNLMRKQRISSILRLTQPSQRNDPSENLLKLERDRMVWSCISALPYKVQCVIILKYINDLSQEDIAKALNIPVGTVKSRLHNGLQRLGLQLKEVVPND